MQIICQHLEVKQGERGEPLHIPGLIISAADGNNSTMKERNLLGYFGDLLTSATPSLIVDANFSKDLFELQIL